MNRTAASVALVALTAFALTGCTLAGASGAPPAPTPDAVALAGERWSGTSTGGSVELAYEVPEGAQTMVLKFGCTGYYPNSHAAQFDIQIVPLERFRSGTCDGIRQWEFAVPTMKQPLSVWLPADVSYVAELSFRTDPTHVDAAIEADCAAFSPIQSAFFNADIGFAKVAAITEQEWRDRVGTATADLQDLAADATSLLSAPLAIAAESVTAPGLVPGTLIEQPAYRDAQNLIASICVNNDTQLTTMGEFGG